MRVSQKLEYACRAAIQLAKHYDGESPLRLDDLASREHVPATFLVQILSDLKQANLVISRRGKSGGYLLSAAPADISLARIIEAVDPQLLEEPAVSEGESGEALHQIWQGLTSTLSEKLQSTTLDQLAHPQEEPMWFI
ncbi:RrF2 family transcriptional regulator [Roseibacillus persicicus]|uniref:Rrf2 family transcriptional regulator n=1 Tax=Roseibacillus persicicus TaxID=454148 RepID=A0A918TH39_9BACT|nr:Rrf2 family transcriptional regulator [Roseibacillus persicicus]MDQ8191092.1 Rrf2 family transcriptional regulator [Roseibacillus persicicus]GHC47593.1 Rrf2 family transcriptional regulator [Roseibacillus persicicus]